MPEIKKYLSKNGLEDYNTLLSNSATLVQDGSITTVKLADGSVTNPKLADGSVTNQKLADGSVTNPKLADGSVTNQKLAKDVKDVINLSIAANTLMGEPSESTWAQRTSTGSGMARVKSVQGAAVVWNQLNNNASQSITKNGITWTNNGDGSWTANGTATAYTNYGITPFTRKLNHKYLVKGCPSGGSLSTYALGIGGSLTDIGTGGIYTSTIDTIVIIYFIIYANITVTDLVVWPQVFDLTEMFGAGNEPTVAEFNRLYPEQYYPYSMQNPITPVRIAGIASTDAQGNALDSIEWTAQTLRAAGSERDELTSDELIIRVDERAYQSGDESDTTVRTDGTTTYYPLTTPIITPITPALQMTYKIERGGSESIITPEGEISAAPLITLSEGESAADLVMNALAAIAAPDGPTATTNHSVNTYLTMSGKLYKVTTAIAAGETITAGVNVTQTTVMAELIARTT